MVRAIKNAAQKIGAAVAIFIALILIGYISQIDYEQKIEEQRAWCRGVVEDSIATDQHTYHRRCGE